MKFGVFWDFLGIRVFSLILYNFLYLLVFVVFRISGFPRFFGFDVAKHFDFCDFEVSGFVISVLFLELQCLGCCKAGSYWFGDDFCVFWCGWLSSLVFCCSLALSCDVFVLLISVWFYLEFIWWFWWWLLVCCLCSWHLVESIWVCYVFWICDNCLCCSVVCCLIVVWRFVCITLLVCLGELTVAVCVCIGLKFVVEYFAFWCSKCFN